MQSDYRLLHPEHAWDKQNKNMHQNKHTPVLLEAVLKCLNPKPNESYLDLTAGYGGHALAVLGKTKNGQAVLVDRDKQAIEHLKGKTLGKQVRLVNKDFLSASQELLDKGEKFDLILADLGISSPHLNTASRGFSLSNEGPLDMRMDQNQTLDAYQVVNNYSEKQLTKIIRDNGEEPKARKIAGLLVKNRPIKNTHELALIVANLVKRSKTRKRIHPATKTFQAIRIEVNDELGQLEKALPMWLELLNPGGRIAVISFHSLEDRLVKKALRVVSGTDYEACFKLLNKKPIVGDDNELDLNPRARSAKLRAAVKIKTKEGTLHANTSKK